MAKVIVVLLRKPRRNDPNETRADPFWEYGSFGCTGCHGRNLLNPKKLEALDGSRLAFVQGGDSELRLLLVTTPIKAARFVVRDKMGNPKTRGEAKWDPPVMPFRYDRAPLAINNDGLTDVPCLLPVFAAADRSTMVGRFASSFRSRREPLPEQIGNSLLRRWRQLVEQADTGAFAERYEEALPYLPNTVIRDRLRSYRETSGMKIAPKSGRSGC